MRILVVASYYKPAYVYGGPTRSISTMCESLVRAGADVTVLTTNANGESRLGVSLGRPLDVDGVEVSYYPLAFGLYFYSPALAAAVQSRASEFDVVVADTLWSHALAPTASACARGRVPFILPTHGQLQPWALRRKAVKKKAYLMAVGKRAINRASAFHCTDHAEMDAVTHLGMRPPAFVVPNGIDTLSFAQLPSRGALRLRLGIPARAVQLLFLGRLVEIKRPDLAVSTLGALVAAGRDAHLVLAGPDQQHLSPKLRAQAAGLGCEQRVHFAGLLTGTEVLQAFADTDLFVMPTEVQENFGMSAVEAMAAGVPVLVSEGVPVGRWAQAAGAGEVAPCTVDAFAAAALDLVSCPEQLKVMGQRGSRLARERFDAGVVASEMLAQFEAILATGQPLPDCK